MKNIPFSRIVLSGFALLLSAWLAGCATIPQSPSPAALSPSITPSPVLTSTPLPSLAPTVHEAAPSPAPQGSKTYTDPDSQFSLQYPAGWVEADDGSFHGADGFFRPSYLDFLGSYPNIRMVCEAVANTTQNGGQALSLASVQAQEACTLTPAEKAGAGEASLVVQMPTPKRSLRYLLIQADQAHLQPLAESLQFLNPAPPDATLEPAGESSWPATVPAPAGLTIEEHPVVEKSVDTPGHFEFKDRIPAEVFQKRAAWRGNSPEIRLAGNNPLLKPFGYSLKAKSGGDMPLYELYQGDRLLQDNIDAFWPVSVSASGSDFALVVEILNGGCRLVRKDTLEEWDMSASLNIPPVYNGEDLIRVNWDPARSQVQLLQGDRTLYAFTALFMVSSPAKGLWSWDGHWVLEVDGFVIQDGMILNGQLGYDEMFGWQLLDGKPFYYFRVGSKLGISYDGHALPVQYDDIVHYQCCEPAVFNPAGNGTMVWFHALKDGKWYYVEMGVY